MCRCDRHLNLRPAPSADVVCVLILHSNVKRNAAEVERSVKCLNVSIVVSAGRGKGGLGGGDWAESKQTVGTDTGLSVIVRGRVRAQSAHSAAAFWLRLLYHFDEIGLGMRCTCSTGSRGLQQRDSYNVIGCFACVPARVSEICDRCE